MKASEILRGLAELLDVIEKVQSPAPANTAVADDVGKFLPPLQSKIELLKKATGVESEYVENQPNLDHMKRMAGINIAVINDAADDEPLDV